MTTESTDEMIAKVAAEHGLTVIDCRVVEFHLISRMPREDYEYDSYIIGTEVVLGRYPGEDDVRLAAFLHEVGHRPEPGGRYYREEREAWDVAERIASERGIVWTPAMTAYRERCLATYEERRLADEVDSGGDRASDARSMNMQKMEILRGLFTLVFGRSVFSITYRGGSETSLEHWEFLGPNAKPRIDALSLDALLDTVIVQLTKDAELGVADSLSKISDYKQLRRELSRLEIPSLNDILNKPAGSP